MAQNLCLRILFTIGLVVFSTLADAADPNLQKIESAQPEWLFSNDDCPADVMPVHLILDESSGDPEYCVDRMLLCLSSCRSGSARDCYFAAHGAQRLDHRAASEALYLMACRLGIPSGCTNRAAGRLTDFPSDRTCSIRTFEKTCAAEDPWGCTMAAYFLYEGVEVERNLAKASRLLEGSCRYGDQNRACQVAGNLQKLIAEEEAGSEKQQ